MGQKSTSNRYSPWHRQGPHICLVCRQKALRRVPAERFGSKAVPARELADASVGRIEIARPAQTARVTIHTARPGIVIGKKGEDVDKLRKELTKRMGVPVHINIEEIRKPELDAVLVAQNVAQQLERRVQFRRAMRRVIQNAMRLGAEGIKVRVAGRLGGAEIARSEVYHEGRVPLHTLRADIDYATFEAETTYGILGIKVWIFKGEVIGSNTPEAASQG